MRHSDLLILFAACALLVPHARSQPAAAPANPPKIPDISNGDDITCFPDRDFVSVAGFKRHAGKTAMLVVYRQDESPATTWSIMSTATAEISGGDDAFEVNHPGGVCWDKVTPDIRAGDVIELVLLVGEGPEVAQVLGDLTVSSFTVSKWGTAQVSPGGTFSYFQVFGTFGPDVDPTKGYVEQRIRNKDLKDTAVGKQDLSAFPSAETFNPDVPFVPTVWTNEGAYWHSFATATAPVDGKTAFVSSFRFDYDVLSGGRTEAETLIGLARAGQFRAMYGSQDATGAPLLLTISEFGEISGPGFGGCPPGPGDLAPPTGTAVTTTFKAATSTAGPQVTLRWGQATALPGTPAVIGYIVMLAYDETATLTKSYAVIVNSATVTSHTFDVADGSSLSNFKPIVRALSAGTQCSVGPEYKPQAPAPAPAPAPAGEAVPDPEITLTLDGSDSCNPSASCTGAEVTITTSDGYIYYTTDGSEVSLGAAGPTADAKVYTDPIPIAGGGEPVTLKVMGVSSRDDVRFVTYEYSITNNAAALALPEFEIVTSSLQVGPGSVTFSWAEVVGESSSDTIEPREYLIQWYDTASAPKLLDSTTTNADQTSKKGITITNLASKPTQFTVTPLASNLKGKESAKSPAQTPQTKPDRIAITSSRWDADKRRLRLGGTIDRFVAGGVLTIKYKPTAASAAKTFSTCSGGSITEQPPLTVTVPPTPSTAAFDCRPPSPGASDLPGVTSGLVWVEGTAGYTGKSEPV